MSAGKKTIHYWFLVIPLLLLMSCMTTLYVRENKDVVFSQTKKIYVETAVPVTIDLAPKLRSELVKSGFEITDDKEDAGYIITLDYKARFDVSPWIFLLFNLKMTDAQSGIVFYKVNSNKYYTEAVDSVIKRTVRDMAKRFSVSPRVQHEVTDSTQEPHNDFNPLISQ